MFLSAEEVLARFGIDVSALRKSIIFDDVKITYDRWTGLYDISPVGQRAS